MQRFLAIGHSRVHVLEAGVHDPLEARRVVATLDALRPNRLWFDLSSPEFVEVLHNQPPAGLHKRIVSLSTRAGAVEPFAVYRAAHAWAERMGVRVSFLLGNVEPLRRLDLWRLDRLLRREGFEAATPSSTAARLHFHFVSRVKGLVAWQERRWDQAARALLDSQREAGVGGILVCAVPDGEHIADRVQRMPKP